MDASAGVEAGLEHAVALGRSTGTRGVLLHQQVRPRERRPDGGARRAARQRSATRSRRSRSRSARPSRSRATSTSSIARPGGWDGRRRSRSRSPTSWPARSPRRRDQLLEAAAEADDDVLTKYLEGEEISDPELEACLRKGVKDIDPRAGPRRQRDQGHRPARPARRDRPLPPLPRRRGAGRGDATSPAPRSRSPPTRTARSSPACSRPTADPFVGRLTYLRVLSGTLHSQAHVWNATRDEDERIGQLLLLHGKEQEPIGELKAGEIGAVAKLAVTETGDTLASSEKPLSLPPLDFPEPSLVVAIEPQCKGDLDKMGPALAADARGGADRRGSSGPRPASRSCARWARPTPRSSSSGSSASSGRRSSTHTPKVPYKETIRGKTQVHGRYKKQTGGHGMFGDVWLELEPNPDGGVEFAERVVGGSVPKGFFAGVEKGIREAAAEGVLAGYPLSDFRATLYDGSFHPVDSNEMSFKIAASMALKDGVHQAKPALLEPIMAVEIRVPEAYMGEVNRDLNGRRGRVLGMDTDGECRSSAPTCPRPSCSPTRRSCAHWPRAVARSPHARPLRGRARPHRREGHRGAHEGTRGREPRRALALITPAKHTSEGNNAVVSGRQAGRQAGRQGRPLPGAAAAAAAAGSARRSTGCR